jgi:nicotinate phosphoribosyltransferase
VRIFASGGIDEYVIEQLVTARAPVDAVGVGTHLAVVSDAPVLDAVYKLVGYDGRPTPKTSEGKTTLPGTKQVFRSDDLMADFIGLRDELPPDGTRPVLELHMKGGRRLRRSSIEEIRQRLLAQLELLHVPLRDLGEPTAPDVRLTSALCATRDSL